MSSVYVLEPPTKGKVVLQTTYGPLDIELWPKEAPKATRNFVQLCLEGYYDNTIFHRVIKSFLVQGGDPTGTGTGGESMYGSPFADEFHSRLRFNHRGLVACANAGSPHSNGSQFFISLDRCDWLDRKNTIFGKVTGDSIFNLLTLGDVETDKNDRPLDPPPRILSVEVLWNPYDDIVLRSVKPKSLSLTLDITNKVQKKSVKNLKLLSFQEEAEEEERDLAAVKDKIKSSHDVLNDPRLLRESVEKDLSLSEAKQKKELHLSVREALSSNKNENKRESQTDHSDSDESTDDRDDEAKFDAHMRLQILRKRKELDDTTIKQRVNEEKTTEKKTRVASPRSNVEDSEDSDQHNPKKEKLSLKKKAIGSEARAELLAKADGDLQLLDQAERQRQMQKQKKRRLQGRAEETLAKLEKFRKSVLKLDGAGDDEDTSGWMSHKLKFMPDPSTKDGMTRKDDPNEYVVHDPLLEKGKEKFNKMQAKIKRREREWAGKSIT